MFAKLQYLVYYSNSIPKNDNNISIHPKLEDKIYDFPYLYFFNDILFLAQDCSTLESALYISANWYVNNYNYKYCNKSKIPENYNLYNTQGIQLITASDDSPDIIKVSDNKFVALLFF